MIAAPLEHALAKHDAPWRSGFGALIVIHLLAWGVVPMLLQPNVSLDVVELVAWGHEWQWGYANHPPLPAWIAEIVRQLAGAAAKNALILLGQAFVLAAFWGAWLFAKQFAGDAEALAAILVLEASPLYTRASTEFNHNVAILPFSVFTVLALYRALAEGHFRWWAMLGLALGLGLLCKYVIALLGLSIAGWFLLSRRGRIALSTPGPYLALAITALVFLPHAAWIITHEMIPLDYISERGASTRGTWGHLLNPADFLVSQATYLLPMLLVAWPLFLLRDEPRGREPARVLARSLVLAATCGPLLGFLAISAVSGLHIRQSWGIPLWIFIGLALLTGFGPVGHRRLRALACSSLLLATVVWVVMVVAGLRPSESAAPPRTRFPGAELARRVTEEWNTRFRRPLELVGGELWLASNVNFYSRDRPSTLTGPPVYLGRAGLDSRVSPWASPADFEKRGGILVWWSDVEGSEVPADLRAELPDAEAQRPLILPYSRETGRAPAEIGWAIQPPRPRHVE